MPDISAQEWETRCDLAAAYRLIAHFGERETHRPKLEKAAKAPAPGCISSL